MVRPPTTIQVRAAPGATSGVLSVHGKTFACALGRGGLVGDKREGDGGTPCGRFLLREVLWRRDRGPAPVTGLVLSEIRPEDGWCDDPTDPQYNRRVRLPHVGRCEMLWREDDVYDLLAVIGWNDDPPAAGKGSAIFLHVAREGVEGFEPTEGCVALRRDDLREVLAYLVEGAAIEIAVTPAASKPG
ncbi:MAG TPA: L,D-transpeptidase family protein [Caulobacteraceae bacterium]|jgi:L,D-peptidoglycan transpeptidase YkuD (ErfK/YbiS/YcfS/YnhG family)